MTIKLLLVAPAQDTLAALAAVVAGSDPSVEVTSAIGGVADLVTRILDDAPDLAMCALGQPNAGDLSLIGATLTRAARTALIMVAPDDSADFLIQAMRAGVREVVSASEGPQALAAAMGRQLQRFNAARAPARQAPVHAFIPVKGGAGSTFLATNLGHALVAARKRVALLDLNLHYGDAAMFVSEQQPPSTIADLAQHVHRLDAALLQSSLLAVDRDYALLAAPESPERAGEVQPEAVERIIALSKLSYDFVLMDVGRRLEAATVRALDQADTIWLVMQQTLPYLHNARQMLDVLRKLDYPAEKLKLVVNRFDKNSDVNTAQIEKALGVEVSVELPNSYANVAYSVNHATPIVKHAPRDPMSRALTVFASRLAPPPADADRGGRWLRKVFRG